MNIRAKHKRNLNSTLLSIALLNLPTPPFSHMRTRRNHRQELIVLLLFYADKNNDTISYFLLRDVFKGYGRLGWQELMGSLRQSGYVETDGKDKSYYKNFYLTDKGRAFARRIDKDLQAEHKALRKLYKDTTK